MALNREEVQLFGRVLGGGRGPPLEAAGHIPSARAGGRGGFEFLALPPLVPWGAGDDRLGGSS